MPRLTEEQLAQIERQYTPPEDQRCVVCGTVLTVVSSSASGSFYACPSNAASLIKNPFGDRKSREHYRRSRWCPGGPADPRVVQLVQELREARLPVAEQLDLTEVDASRAALEGVLREVRALPLPVLYGRKGLGGYFKAVTGIVENHLRQWGAAEQEISP